MDILALFDKIVNFIVVKLRIPKWFVNLNAFVLIIICCSYFIAKIFVTHKDKESKIVKTTISEAIKPLMDTVRLTYQISQQSTKKIDSLESKFKNFIIIQDQMKIQNESKFIQIINLQRDLSKDQREIIKDNFKNMDMQLQHLINSYSLKKKLNYSDSINNQMIAEKIL